MRWEMQGAAKERFNEIKQELSQIGTKFSNNLLDATKAFKRLVQIVFPSVLSACMHNNHSVCPSRMYCCMSAMHLSRLRGMSNQRGVLTDCKTEQPCLPSLGNGQGGCGGAARVCAGAGRAERREGGSQGRYARGRPLGLHAGHALLPAGAHACQEQVLAPACILS